MKGEIHWLNDDAYVEDSNGNLHRQTWRVSHKHYTKVEHVQKNPNYKIPMSLSVRLLLLLVGLEVITLFVFLLLGKLLGIVKL